MSRSLAAHSAPIHSQPARKLACWPDPCLATINPEKDEARVLSGCVELLAYHKPLLLIECGHANPLVCKQLLKSGNTFAGRVGRQLQPANRPTTAINGFFFHPLHAEEYLRIGLLRP